MTKEVSVDELFEGNEPEEEMFTAAELEEIKKEAEATVHKALKDAERARLKAEAIQEIKRQEGLKSGRADLDEKVEIYIDLPEYAATLKVNMTEYHHGYKYIVPRHVATSLRDMMARAWTHQDIAEGKDLASQYRGRDRHGRELKAAILSGGEGRA